jgi:signal transduction histidine kinase
VVFEGKKDFVLGDLDRIIQVITNIVDNAIKYANEGGNIKITTRSKGNKIYISVANEGIVLKDSEINNIWNRFYKADKSRTNKMSTGLGLSIVREIITQHGQDIWVENEKDNSGVVFTFTLSKSN